MFFPRLRRRAKWVFLLLAIIFGGGFILFGVGAGGSGIGDYFADVFNRDATSTGGSVEDAQERVRENPDDANARLALANALQSDGRVEEAIVALERYTEMKPKDTDALQQLAALYSAQALDARENVGLAQLESQESVFLQDIQQPESQLSEELLGAPVSQALQERASERTNEALAEMREAYQKQQEVYQRLAVLLPDDANVSLQLAQAAELGGDYTAAIAAYQQFLELAPDDANAPLVRARIKELRALTGGAIGTTGG